MSLESKLENIEIDIQNGLKFKSADRLRNLINQYPNEQELWNRLAELYYESGFLDGAGRYWILTEPTNDRIKKSVEVYEKSVNYSGYQILQEITFRGEKDKLTEYGQKKLTELENDSSEKVSYIPKFAENLNRNERKIQKNIERTYKEKLIEKLIIGFLIFILISAIIGIVEISSWLF